MQQNTTQSTHIRFTPFNVTLHITFIEEIKNHEKNGRETESKRNVNV